MNIMQLEEKFDLHKDPSEFLKLWNEIKSNKEIISEAIEIDKNNSNRYLKGMIISELALGDGTLLGCDKELTSKFIQNVFSRSSIYRYTGFSKQTFLATIVNRGWKVPDNFLTILIDEAVNNYEIHERVSNFRRDVIEREYASPYYKRIIFRTYSKEEFENMKRSIEQKIIGHLSMLYHVDLKNYNQFYFINFDEIIKMNPNDSMLRKYKADFDYLRLLENYRNINVRGEHQFQESLTTFENIHKNGCSNNCREEIYNNKQINDGIEF